MGDHGIHTSEAEWWCHLHPLEPALYLYRRQDCIDYVAFVKLKQRDGRSRNGSVTGRGYVVPKKTSFILRRGLAAWRVEGIDWKNASNREVGFFRGQEIVLKAMREGVFFSEVGTIVVMAGSYEAEMGGWDLESARGRIEVKTECIVSSNLFIQTWESGHVATLKAGGEIDDVDLPPFADDLCR